MIGSADNAGKSILLPCDHIPRGAHPSTSCMGARAGTGQAAGELSKRYRHVIAEDVSQTQLDQAASSCKDASHVQFRKGAAESISLQDDSVNLVTIAQALHWCVTPLRKLIVQGRLRMHCKESVCRHRKIYNCRKLTHMAELLVPTIVQTIEPYLHIDHSHTQSAQVTRNSTLRI